MSLKKVCLYAADDKNVTLEVDVVANAASGSRIVDCECILISTPQDSFVYKGTTYVKAEQDQLTVDELTLLVVANIRSAVAAGWEGKDAELVASTHIMAFLLGGEWRVVDDPDVNTISVVEKDIMERFDRIAYTGSLVCAMGTINHYSINHTTGASRGSDSKQCASSLSHTHQNALLLQTSLAEGQLSCYTPLPIRFLRETCCSS